MAKGQLHELLAVESDLDNVWKKVMQEAESTFGRPDRFNGNHEHYQPFNEEALDSELDKHHAVTTTVKDKLDYLKPHAVRFFDAVAQKDRTNQEARTDVTLPNGKVLKDVPATTLLGLETKLKRIRQVLEAIPTLAPGIVWELDDQERVGIFQGKHQEEKFRELKDTEFRVVVEPTEHHPAQVKELDRVIRVGKTVTNRWSGMISSKAKSELLARLDESLRIVKKGRTRANTAEVQDIHVAQDLMDFILG